MKFPLRQATIEDAETLADLGRQTFFETFADQNTKDDMDLYLSQTFTAEKLKNELSDSNVNFFLFDSEFGSVAYMKLRDHGDSLEVERLYVLKQFQNKKLGKQLMEYAISLAEKMKKKRIWLGVWEKNLRAIDFYERFGFTIFGSHVFLLGTDEQNDLLIEKALLDTAS